MATSLTNWAGNYQFNAARLHRPTSVEQVQEIVAKSERARPLGTRHSFNPIADTDGDLISAEGLNQILDLDRERRQVTVQGGIRYGDLCHYLNDEGFALHNLASLPHISVAGACATATHGSGDRNGCLSAAVAGLEVVTANGEVKRFQRGDSGFEGAVVALGALGVVTGVTLDVLPAFSLGQEIYQFLPFESVEAHYDEITSCAYSVSLFTDWGSDKINQVWVKGRHAAEMPADLFGAAAATQKLHPIAHMSPEFCTDQLGVVGPWFDRLAHFRLEFTPSSGEELQSEYLVPRPRAKEALQAVNSMRDRISPLLQISEVRTIAADDLWMSPFYRQDGVGIHFTWKKDWESVRRLLPEIEALLLPLGARPHWGKLFAAPMEQVAPMYERLPDFRRLVREYDPEGKFQNAFVEGLLRPGS